MKKILLVAIFVLSFCCVGYAAEYNWEYIGSANDGAELHIATNSVEKYESNYPSLYNLSENLYAVWIRFVNKDSTYSLQRVSCDIKNKKMNVIAVVSYDEEHQLIDSWNNPIEEWTDIVPQSMGESVIEVMMILTDPNANNVSPQKNRSGSNTDDLSQEAWEDFLRKREEEKGK